MTTSTGISFNNCWVDVGSPILGRDGSYLVSLQPAFFVLINGSSEGFFEGFRRLCQGDPLSPMLFDIVMKGLSRMMDRAVQSGYVSSFFVGNSDPEQLVISHLIFADDTLIFCDADPHQLTFLRYVFTWFEVVFGLKIIWANPNLFQWERWAIWTLWWIMLRPYPKHD